MFCAVALVYNHLYSTFQYLLQGHKLWLVLKICRVIFDGRKRKSVGIKNAIVACHVFSRSLWKLKMRKSSIVWCKKLLTSMTMWSELDYNSEELKTT
jgi:hypothetical protein